MQWPGDGSRIKAHFDRDGFIRLEGFISPDEAKAVNDNIDRYIAEVLPQLPEDGGFYDIKDDPDSLMRLQNMSEHDPYFADLFAQERFVGLGQMLLDDQVVRRNMQWFNKPARIGNHTPPHQDGYYFQIEPNIALTMWLALDPVDQVNGCVRYLKGSHQKGLRPHQRTDVIGFSQGITDYNQADNDAEIPIYAQPGDLIVHHSLTVHRADANPSDHPRRALGFVYFAARAREDRSRTESYRKQLVEDWKKEGKL